LRKKIGKRTGKKMTTTKTRKSKNGVVLKANVRPSNILFLS